VKNSWGNIFVYAVGISTIIVGLFLIPLAAIATGRTIIPSDDGGFVPLWGYYIFFSYIAIVVLSIYVYIYKIDRDKYKEEFFRINKNDQLARDILHEIHLKDEKAKRYSSIIFGVLGIISTIVLSIKFSVWLFFTLPFSILIFFSTKIYELLNKK